MMSSYWKRRIVSALVVGLSVILLTACGGFGPGATVAPPSQARPIEVGVAPVTTGNISVTTLYAAISEAKRLVDVVPLASGRLEKLTVDIGSEVTEGQLIAEVGHGTLDAQLEQAQAKLRGAQAGLASVEVNSEPKRIKAQAQLDAAVAKVDQLSTPLPSELRVAESAVTAAQTNLESAKTKVGQLLNPTASDLQTAESAVSTAQTNLNSAKTKLDQLLNPTASDLQAVRSAVSTAQSNLDSKKTTLDQLQNPTAAALAAALEAVSDAQSKVSTAQTKVHTAISNELTLATIPVEMQQPWQSLLNARVREQATVATLRNPDLLAALTPAEIAEAELSVTQIRDTITSLLVQITTSSIIPIPEDINNAMSTETSEQKALETAEQELEELRNPSQNSIAVASNNVAIARAAVDSAEANLDDLLNADQNTIALAQNAVAVAQAALDSAEATGAEVQNADQSTIALAQYGVDAAQASLEAAAARLDLLKQPKPADVAAAEAAVISAGQTLAVTQEPYTQYEIDAAQADVDEAQAQVELIMQRIVELQVFAPFDGYVTHRWLAAGAMASPQKPIVTVASSEVVVSLRVEETGISSLQEGQRVTFTSPALSGQDLELEIDWIAPTGDQNTFTFLVQLRPAGGIEDLKPGMSGQVTFVAQHENVSLVPKEAILRQGGQPALFVVQDGRARLQPVDVGLIDDTNMEIRSGIQPGDQIVVSGHNLLNEGDPVSIQGPPRAAASSG